MKKVRNHGASNQHRIVDIVYVPTGNEAEVDDSVFPPLSSFWVTVATSISEQSNPYIRPRSYARVNDPLR